MRKILGLFMIMLLVASCSTDKTSIEEPIDKWNGYFDKMKDGPVTHTFYAGQDIDVGTVTYGITGDAEFYVTYACTGDWKLVETHMFAGQKNIMPLTKPGNPRIGRFPYATDHDPWVSEYTYYVPLTELPGYETGFSVAAHAVVENTATNQNETAWAYGMHTFTDKGWGWYDDVSYDELTPDDFIILYGIEYDDENLILWLIDMTNGGTESEVILVEPVGNTTGEYDGSAYDDATGNFFFVKDGTELYVNNLNNEDASDYIGALTGTTVSADYQDGSYYYVDAAENTIHEVTFDSDWNMTDNLMDSIPSTVVVTDIAISPDGTVIYMVGNVGDGTTEMITYDMVADSYATIDLALEEDTQIAYGDDGILYAVEPSGMGTSSSYTIDTNTGTVIEINEDDVIIVDPFSDISKGTTM
jgi:hypothetical protein